MKHESNIFGYVYLITNLINNKLYIGQKKSPCACPGYFGSGKIIKQAVRKYGEENFSIRVLFWCWSIEDLNKTEKAMIHLYRKVYGKDRLYNISIGGNGHPRGHIIMPKRGPISDETKKKISESRKGKRHKPETIEKMRQFRNTHKDKLRNRLSHLNQKMSPEHKNRLIAYWTGNKHSEETKKKMSEARRLYWANK